MTSDPPSRGRRTDTARRGGPPRRIGDLVGAFLGRRGLAQAIEDHRIFVAWDQLVGPAIAREARPFKIEKGVLWIGVTSAPQANALLYLKPVLLQKVRGMFPGSRIRDLRILHRPMRGPTERECRKAR